MDQQVEFNRNMTNDQIKAIPGVKEALDSGKIVLIHKEPTSHPGFTNMYFIGKVEGLSSSNTSVSSLAAQLLGWGDNYQRAIQNASTEIAEQFPLGSAIDGAIRVTDTHTRGHDNHKPRIDRNGAQLLNDGKPIYRHTEVCTHDELSKKGHNTLEVTERVGTQQPSQPVNAGQQSSQQVAGQGDTTSNPQQGASIGNLIGGQA